MTPSSPPCSCCRRGGVFAKGRCHGCYRFWKRTGRDRTPAELQRLGDHKHAARVRREELRVILDQARREAG